MIRDISIIVIFFAIVSIITFFGLHRVEKAECLRWIDDSKELSEWYFTDWQKKQCLYYNIKLK